MTSLKINYKFLLSVLILTAGLFVSYLVFAQTAQNAAPPPPSGPTSQQIDTANIVFPIPELGNCQSKDACRSYCESPVNMSVCIAFAKSHGLMDNTEADTAQKFAEQIKAGETPGGCKSPQECESFCSDIKNIDVCIKFAEHNGLNDSKIQEGKKVLAYLQAGGQMPGGCTSQSSCEAYCSDFDHAEECLNFSEKSGVGGPPPEAGGEGPQSIEQMRKVIELTKQGQSPGGCKTKDQCESYCGDSAHFDECIAFAEKAGFVTKDQAEMARKTGGKGPGGCNSENSCKSYCNDPSHQDECFNFAKDRGLIPEAQLQQMQQGMQRLKQGLSQAPPEVVSCLKSTIGPNIIEDIQGGKLLPGPEIGDRVKNCFEKFMGEGMRGGFASSTGSQGAQGLQNLPPAVLSCLKNEIGSDLEDIVAGKKAPGADFGEKIGKCFKAAGINPGGMMNQRTEGGMAGFNNMPPQLSSCIQNKIGSDVFQRISSGGASGDDAEKFKEAMKDCNETSAQSQFPPPVLSCIKAKVGSDTYEKILKGEISNIDMQSVIQTCMGAPAGGPGMMPPVNMTPPSGINNIMPPGGTFPSSTNMNKTLMPLQNLLPLNSLQPMGSSGSAQPSAGMMPPAMAVPNTMQSNTSSGGY